MIYQRLYEYGSRRRIPKLPSPPSQGKRSHCLITGKNGPTLRTHPTFKKDGTWNIQGMGGGGKLSSVNSIQSALFEGMDQGDVGPISKAVAMRVEFAQSKLMASESPNSVCFGHYTLVIFTEKKTKIEQIIPRLVFGSTKSWDVEKRRAWLANPESTESGPIFVLLLMRRKGRKAVKAFCETTIDELVERIGNWQPIRSKIFKRGGWNVARLCDFIENRTPPKKEKNVIFALDPTNEDPHYIAGRQLAVVDVAAKKLQLEMPSVFERSIIHQQDVNVAIQRFHKYARRLGQTPFSRLANVFRALLPKSAVEINTLAASRARLNDGYLRQLQWTERLNHSKCEITKRGDVVRSKGEKVIADCLNKFPATKDYVYELPIQLEGDTSSYRLPDFTLYRDRQRVLIEYLGSAHDADDDPKWEQKLKAYQANNYDVHVIHDQHGKKKPEQIVDEVSAIVFKLYY